MLLLASFGFWFTLLRLSAPSRWHAIALLLLSGKFACLLAALLTFSPRLLYAPALAVHGAHVGSGSLADQQLAGLLMIIACPLSYVVAGVTFAAQIILRVTKSTDPRRSAVAAG
jgi:putative membrane protein